MLVHDNLPRRQNNADVQKKESINPRKLTSTKNRRRYSSSTVVDSRLAEKIADVKKKNKPFWLQSLMVLGHGSSTFCYLSVAIAFVMYGMTVYAPKQWTNKYNKLQELQKQERQFSFTEEIIKNQLAESAKQSGSGLINPDPTQPPIFLPEITPKTVELNKSDTVEPKQIEKISPIAY
ncbi:hypothetical protein ACN4EE_16230 [Geminocystis sp. CENA526]|uniref:hypothetical protein n=1 Tax=Geminocystis sp. CENA526 TaxID=1355871 RepID=UPI003D6F0834